MRRLVHLRDLHGLCGRRLDRARGGALARGGRPARLRLRRQAELAALLPDQGDRRARRPGGAHPGLSGTLRLAGSARQRDVARLNALDAGLLHILPGRGKGALRVDASAGILDDRGGEAERARIHRRPGDAKVRGKTRDVDRLDAACVEVAVEAGLRAAVGFHERRIAVDAAIEALANNELRVRDIDILVDRGTVGTLYAVVRPQDLLAVGELDAFKRLLAGMR